MILSASLASCKGNKKDYIEKLKSNGINMLHIDYIEGGNFSKKDLLAIDNIWDSVLFDIHIISDKINEKDVDFFNKIEASYMCYQYENLIETDIGLLKKFNGKTGLAFTIESQFEDIMNVIGLVDFVMIMCTVPGVSGQGFNSDNIERIRDIHTIYPNLEIHVDGGIDARRIEVMKRYNVALAVVGSFLTDTEENLTEKICQLRYSETDITVEEVMIPIDCLMTINYSDPFETVLRALEKDKLSIVTVVKDNQLIGIITDGDVRRTLIKYNKHSFEFTAGDIMNSMPRTLSYNTKVCHVLYDRLFLEKGVMAIPCIKNKKIIGVLDCTTL